VNRRRRGAAERGLFEYQLVASEGFRGYDQD
jgi:hypothetical protein